MIKSNLFKLCSFVLVLALCLTVLFGCNKDTSQTSSETEYKGYLYSAEAMPADEVASVDEVNDDVTRIIIDNITELFELDENEYITESHSIITGTESVKAGSTALVLREKTYIYDPATGAFDVAEWYPTLCVITFKDSNGTLSAAEYTEYVTDDADNIQKAFEKAAPEMIPDEAIAEAGKNLTPYRFIKGDGLIYLVDTQRYASYCDMLVAEILTHESKLFSYADYVSENSEAFDKLVSAPNAVRYLIGEFLKGDNNTAKGYVMYRALDKLLENSNEGFGYQITDEGNAQSYFDTLLGYALVMRADYGCYKNLYRNPIWCTVVEMYDDSLTNEELLKEQFIYPVPDSITVIKGSESVTFTRNDEKFFEIFRRNSFLYIPTDDLKTYRTNINVDSIFKDLASRGTDYSEVYIEYKYDDGTRGMIFMNGSEVFLIPKETGERYDAYRGSVSDDTLISILESCF